ncbi:MAG: hypothetical protein QXO98_05545 [Sulfolobales archaeon]
MSLVAIVAIASRGTQGSSNEVNNFSADIETLEDEMPLPSKPITATNLDIIKRINELEALSYKDLVGELNLSREELSTLLNELSSKGYIELSGEYILLTDKGRKLFEVMREKHHYTSTRK